MSHLRPCARCDRHVLAAQTACPFCGAGLELDLSEPLAPPGRLGRAALIALAASVAACQKETPKQTAAPEPTVSQAASAAPSIAIASATASAPAASTAPS